MISAFIALALAAAAPTADGAGNRLEAFAAAAPAPAEGSDEAEHQSAVHCTADQAWCAILFKGSEGDDRDIWTIRIFQGRPGPGAISDRRRYDLSWQQESDSRAAFWPQAVRLADGAVLIGVVMSRSTGFAGGGASAAHLELVRATPESAAGGGVLDVPYGANLDLRACFDADDQRRRRDACSDQFQFSGALTLDPATSAGPPRFRFVASARTYPGRVSRDEDSTQAPPLRPGDLVWANDPECTYRRVFVLDALSGRYEPDQPLPLCNQYFDF